MVNRKNLIAYYLVCSFIQVTICTRDSDSNTFNSIIKVLCADNRRNTSPLYNIHDIAIVQQNNNAIKTKHLEKSRQKRADGDDREDLTLDSIEKSSQAFPLPALALPSEANEDSSTSTTTTKDEYISSTPETLIITPDDANDESDSNTSDGINQPALDLSDVNIEPDFIAFDASDESVSSITDSNDELPSSSTVSKDFYISSTPVNDHFSTVSNDKYVSSTPEPVAIMPNANNEPAFGTRDTNIEQGTFIPEVNAEIQPVSTTSEVNDQPVPNIGDTNIKSAFIFPDVTEPVSITAVSRDVSTSTTTANVSDSSTPVTEEFGSSTTVAEDVPTSPTPANEEFDSSTTISKVVSTSTTSATEEFGSSTTESKDKYSSTPHPGVIMVNVNDEHVSGTRDTTTIEQGFIIPEADAESVFTTSEVNDQPAQNIADTNIKPAFIVPDVNGESVSSTAVPEGVSTSTTPANEEFGSTTNANEEPVSGTRDTNFEQGIILPKSSTDSEPVSTTPEVNDQPASNIANTNIKPAFILPDVIDEAVSSTTVLKDMSSSTTIANDEFGSSTSISEDLSTSTTPSNKDFDSSTTASKDKYISSTPEPVAIATDVNIEPASGTPDTNIEQGKTLPEANADPEPVSTTSDGNNQSVLSITDAKFESGFITQDANEESCSTPNTKEDDLLKTPGQNIESNSVDVKATLNTSDANTKVIVNIPDETREQTFNFPNDNVNVDHYIKRLLKELYRRDIEEMKLFHSSQEKISQPEKNIVEAIKAYNGIHHTHEADRQIDSTKGWRFGDIFSNNDEAYNFFGNSDEPLVELPMNNNYESDMRKSAHRANPNDDYSYGEDRTLNGILRNLGIQLDVSLYSIFVNDFSDKSFTNDKYKSLVTKTPDFDSIDEEYVEQSEAVQSNDDTQDVLFINDPPMYPI